MWVVDRAMSLVGLNGPVCTLLAGIANKAIVRRSIETTIGRLQNAALNQAPLTKVFSQGALHLAGGDALSNCNGRDVDRARHLCASLARTVHECDSGMLSVAQRVSVSAEGAVSGELGLSRRVLGHRVLSRGRRRHGIRRQISLLNRSVGLTRRLLVAARQARRTRGLDAGALCCQEMACRDHRNGPGLGRLMALPCGLTRDGLGRVKTRWRPLVRPIDNNDSGVRGVLDRDRLFCEVLPLQIGW
jgi:hypothetical protein